MADSFKFEGLDKLLKMLKRKDAPIIRVGILGGDASKVHQPKEGEEKSKNPLTNAEIGAIHEYGLGNNPVRSFLRVPLTRNLNKELKRAGLLDKAVFEEVVKTGDIMPWLNKVQFAAEAVVIDAFDSGGDGEWPKSDMSRKQNHQTLVETHQLRDSITTAIVNK